MACSLLRPRIMKRVDDLKKQAREFDELFRLIENAQVNQQRELYAQIASKLVAHEIIEERLFYPACRKAFGDDLVLQEAYAQHAVMSFCLAQAERALGVPNHLATVRALVESVEQDVIEEEREIFPKLASWYQNNASDDEQRLAMEMGKLYGVVVAGDLHVPLYETLNRSLGAADASMPPPIVATPPPLIARPGNGGKVQKAGLVATPKL
jgi:hemerythrin superfamily protein